MVHHWHAAGVDDDERGAALHRPHHLVAEDRVRLGRVGAGDEDTVGVADVADGVRHGGAAERHVQPGDRAGVAEAGAVVHVVGADAGAEEFLEEVVLLVRAAGGGESGHRVRSVGRNHACQSFRHDVQRGLPRYGHEVVGPACLERAGSRQCPRLGGEAQFVGQILAHQGLGQAIGARDEVPAGAALDAQELAVDGRLPVASGVDDALVLRLKLQAAADAAVAADRALGGELRLAPLADARLGQQGRRRADLDAAPAEDARGVDHEAVEGGGDVAGEAPARIVDGVHADDLVADAHALAAEDAVLVVAHEEGVVVLEQRAREARSRSWSPGCRSGRRIFADRRRRLFRTWRR